MHGNLFSRRNVLKLTSVFRFVDAGHDPAPVDGSVLALAVPPFALFLSLSFSLSFFLLVSLEVETLPSFLSLGLTAAAPAAAVAGEPSSQAVVPGSSNGRVRSVRRIVHLC